MNTSEFEEILEQVTINLTNRAQSQGICRDSKEFEEIVLSELRKVCQGIKKNAFHSNHPHAFPDLIVNGFGVEVKHTMKDSWHTIGNSIFEGMRDTAARKIYVIYGKMGGWPAVKWSRYEDCVTHVRISHAPRFVIEMENHSRFFEAIDVEYQEFAGLSPDKKMQLVRQYARKKLREGERLWWLEDFGEVSNTLPLNIRIYRHLPNEEKRQMRAEGALLFPEIVQGSHALGKYDGVSLYLITRHGVFVPQARDLFSAGSVGASDGSRGHKYIITALRSIESEMLHAAASLEDSFFKAYWGEGCNPKDRIDAWLKKADSYAPDWVPSKELFKTR